MAKQENKENSWIDYFRVGEVFTYFFRKKDPSRPSNFNIRAMHKINRLSIIVFLLALAYFVIKKLFLS